MQCYRRLGERLVETPPAESQRLPILRDAWRAITRIPDPAEYFQVPSPPSLPHPTSALSPKRPPVARLRPQK